MPHCVKEIWSFVARCPLKNQKPQMGKKTQQPSMYVLGNCHMDRTGFGQYLLNVNWVLEFISFSDIRGCQRDDKELQPCHKAVSIFEDLLCQYVKLCSISTTSWHFQFTKLRPFCNKLLSIWNPPNNQIPNKKSTNIRHKVYRLFFV